MIFLSCPNCGAKLQALVYTSHPPVHAYICPNCGFQHEEREDVTQVNINLVDKKMQTNADRIRNMTDEELADFICKTQFAFIPKSLGNIPISVYDGMSVLEWLKQEVSDDS